MRLGLLFGFCLIILIVWSGPACAEEKLGANDLHILDLTKRLSQHPELMDAGYLGYELGDPEVRWDFGIPPRKVWEWSEPNNKTLLYKLERQVDQKPGQENSTFTIIPPVDSQLDLKSLEPDFGDTPPTKFDKRVCRTQTFDVSSGTQLVSTEPIFGSKISELAVQYHGPRLPPPSKEQIDEAIKTRRDTAFATSANGQTEDALPKLLAHLQEQPEDVEARLVLADTYKARHNINEAAEEYRLAYEKSGTNDELRQRSLEGLRSLRFLPDTTPSDSTPQNGQPPARKRQRPASRFRQQQLPPVGQVGQPAGSAQGSQGVPASSNQGWQVVPPTNLPPSLTPAPLERIPAPVQPAPRGPFEPSF